MAGLHIHRQHLSAIRWLATACILLLVVACSWYGYRWFTTGQQPPLISLPAHALAAQSIDESAVSSEMIRSHVVAATEPRYISIPILGVERARVLQVGLTDNNMIALPKNINDAAWYRKSAQPGQKYGAVVLSAHSKGVSQNGLFSRIADLQQGDQVIIERGDGEKITYAVVENKTEPIEQAIKSGLQRIMTPYNSSQEGLGLIADAGTWIPRDKVFDKRTLVRATVVE